MDPEKVHYRAMAMFGLLDSLGLGGMLSRKREEKAIDIMGLTFPNRVGLAAGFDKDARWIDRLAKLGFGHIEIGTLTPEPQSGNDKPRLFRLPADKALINRMGFNNGGVVAAVQRLKARKSHVIVGGNIGKNKITPNDQAKDDYFKCFEALYPHVDYFVVNVSSPNTPGLRELQDKKPLTEILGGLMAQNRQKSRIKPILLKIAPDLNEAQLRDIAELVKETGIAGLIATNTTIERDTLTTPQDQVNAIGNGGLSGAPLVERSTEVIRFLRGLLPSPIVIIGVGGVMSGEDALVKLKAGADLIQVYTGFVYEGPGLPGRIIDTTSRWKE